MLSIELQRHEFAKDEERPRRTNLDTPAVSYGRKHGMAYASRHAGQGDHGSSMSALLHIRSFRRS